MKVINKKVTEMERYREQISTKRVVLNQSCIHGQHPIFSRVISPQVNVNWLTQDCGYHYHQLKPTTKP